MSERTVGKRKTAAELERALIAGRIRQILSDAVEATRMFRKKFPQNDGNAFAHGYLVSALEQMVKGLEDGHA